MSTILPYINEFFILSSAGTMAVGWWQIKRQRKVLHRRLMIVSVILAALFFFSYAAKTVLVGDTSFGGSSALKAPYQVFLQMHSVLATVAAVLGVLTLRFGLKRSFANHAKMGRLTAPIWFVTAGTGFAVFLMLYVIYPPGPTVNVFRAWVGL